MSEAEYIAWMETVLARMIADVCVLWEPRHWVREIAYAVDACATDWRTGIRSDAEEK